uniref:Uncharacterized protein n=1 Tax=Strongyloides venezuelensis TaxID=75913 RepID=A0A0K0FZH0_STRVS
MNAYKKNSPRPIEEFKIYHYFYTEYVGSIVSKEPFSARFVILTIIFTMLVGQMEKEFTCEFDCYSLLDFEDGGFFCCRGDSKNSLIHRFSSFLPSDHLNSDRFLSAYGNDFQTVLLFSLMAARLIILTMIFVSLPLLLYCYFLCKSC